MNMKFDDLLYSSGLTANGCWDQLDSYDRDAIMRFAQMIVEKCIDEIEFQYGGGNLMEDDTHNPEWDKAIECVSAMVRHRFGVEG